MPSTKTVMENVASIVQKIIEEIEAIELGKVNKGIVEIVQTLQVDSEQAKEKYKKAATLIKRRDTEKNSIRLKQLDTAFKRNLGTHLAALRKIDNNAGGIEIRNRLVKAIQEQMLTMENTSIKELASTIPTVDQSQSAPVTPIATVQRSNVRRHSEPARFPEAEVNLSADDAAKKYAAAKPLILSTGPSAATQLGPTAMSGDVDQSETPLQSSADKESTLKEKWKMLENLYKNNGWDFRRSKNTDIVSVASNTKIKIIEFNKNLQVTSDSSTPEAYTAMAKALKALGDNAIIHHPDPKQLAIFEEICKKEHLNVTAVPDKKDYKKLLEESKKPSPNQPKSGGP